MKYLSIIAAFIFLGCSVTKQNQKAVNRVKADINLLNDVGNSWQLLHPCAVDTVVQFKTGNDVVKYDTLDFSHTDTLYSVDNQTKTVIQYKTITKYIHRTDTLIRYQIDKRGEQLALDKANALTGENTQLKAQVKSTQSTSSKKTWALIGAGLIILFLAYLLVKPKIR